MAWLAGRLPSSQTYLGLDGVRDVW